MMQQAIEDSGGDDIVVEDLAPLFERLVGGDNGRRLLVALGDELEEELGRLFGKGKIS